MKRGIRILWWPILLLLVGSSCTEETDADMDRSAPEENALRVPEGGVRIWDAPGVEGRVIGEAAAGDYLYDLQSVSEFTTFLQWRGRPMDEPWLKVRTANGTEGWVYGGILYFQPRRDGELKERRFQALAGTVLAGQWSDYRQAFDNIRSAEDFERVYRQGMSLRDELVDRVQEKYQSRFTSGNPLPDLFWLRAYLPGFVPQLINDGQGYYFFADYRVWLEKAAQTERTEDDHFVGIYLTAFPEDSIEYFFPAWTIQTSDRGGHSLLGRGAHLTMFEKLDQALRRSEYFEPELRRLKTDLVNDITRPHVSYWEQEEPIIRELEAILNAGFSFFSERDRALLQARLLQFQHPGAHGITVGVRAGDY